MMELDVQGTAIQDTRTKIIIAATQELGLSTQWNNCMQRNRIHQDAVKQLHFLKILWWFRW